VGATRLKAFRGLAARELAGPITFKFNPKNPAAAAWARKHAVELAEDLTKTTVKQIREALGTHFETGTPTGTVFQQLRDIIHNETRADLIARTEVMTAVNEGQRQSWDQAVDEGWLADDAERVWIATIGACPLCDDLDGTRAPLGGVYDGDVSGPPLHPNCRCTEGIV
jgi:hypothetical protein